MNEASSCTEIYWVPQNGLEVGSFGVIVEVHIEDAKLRCVGWDVKAGGANDGDVLPYRGNLELVGELSVSVIKWPETKSTPERHTLVEDGVTETEPLSSERIIRQRGIELTMGEEGNA